MSKYNFKIKIYELIYIKFIFIYNFISRVFKRGFIWIRNNILFGKKIDSIKSFKCVSIDAFNLHYGVNSNVREILSENIISREVAQRYKFIQPYFNRGLYAELSLINRALLSRDLYSQKMHQAHSAYLFMNEWLTIIYEFNPEAPYFLITSSFDQAKLGIYIPNLNTYVSSEIDEAWVSIGKRSLEYFMANKMKSISFQKLME